MCSVVFWKHSHNIYFSQKRNWSEENITKYPLCSHEFCPSMLTTKFPSFPEEPPSHLGPLDPGGLCHWPPPRSLYALIRRISAPALPSLDPSPLLPHTRTSSHHLSFSILLNGYNPSVRTAHWSENRSTPTPPPRMRREKKLAADSGATRGAAD